MLHHYKHGENLEQILDTIEDPSERSQIIEEAWADLTHQAVDTEVVMPPPEHAA